MSVDAESSQGQEQRFLSLDVRVSVSRVGFGGS